MSEDECGAGDVAVFAGAGGDVLEDVPAAFEQGEPAFAEAAEAASEREASSGANTVIDFGRYAGMTLRQIARVEPGYLEWLRRHSSGLRYRQQIDEVLGA